MSYQDKNLKSLKYKIYRVPNYKKYVLEVKNPKITVEAPCFASRKYEKIVKELETYDCQYHLAIRKDDMLKLNIDIDGMKKSKRSTFLKRVGRQLKSIGAFKYINELKYAHTKNKMAK